MLGLWQREDVVTAPTCPVCLRPYAKLADQRAHEKRRKEWREAGGHLKCDAPQRDYSTLCWVDLEPLGLTTSHSCREHASARYAPEKERADKFEAALREVQCAIWRGQPCHKSKAPRDRWCPVCRALYPEAP